MRFTRISVSSLLLAAGIILLAGCAKNNPDPSTSTAVQTPQQVYGVVEMGIALNDSVSSTYANYGMAEFSNTAMWEDSFSVTNNTIDVGVVSVSGKVMKKTFSPVRYQDTTHLALAGPANCIVSGNSPFPAFVLNTSNTYPGYNGMGSLPDTIHIASNVTIPLTNFANTDRVLVYIHDSNSGMTSVQTGSATATSVTFAPADFSGFSGTKKCSITILFYKNTYQLVDTRTYNFRLVRKITKSHVNWI